MESNKVNYVTMRELFSKQKLTFKIGKVDWIIGAVDLKILI